jgi:arylsulfatase A-like enzyme
MRTILTVFAAIVLSANSPAVEGRKDPRPNILFCLADDWSWPHAGVYGDKVIHTPTFDRVAREGILFNYCFSAAPSCTPSRAAILTGQYPHRLDEGGNLWGFLPKRFPVYTDLLEKTGYAVGLMAKGWGPGDFKAGGYTHNPAGKNFGSFEAFLKTVPEDKPFCFWFGSHDPHRIYVRGSGAAKGLNAAGVKVPPWWPDNDVTRNDILDYYAATERYDTDTGRMLDLLDKTGRLTNTIVVMSGDNGWPFPRCKANLYDGGTRQPLAVYWPAKIKPGRTSDAFINLSDLAPTFLEIAGVKPPSEMTAKSFANVLLGKRGSEKGRDTVFVERERHANVRTNSFGYPMRAIRTREFLYIRNFHPERWPAGDPVAYKDPPYPFGDCDDGPTKRFIYENKQDPAIQPLYELCFAKRPAEELYDLKLDPFQTNNIVESSSYSATRKDMRQRLAKWMKETADPRSAEAHDDRWDGYAYLGGANRSK